MSLELHRHPGFGKFTTYNVSPGLGYDFTKKLAAGLNLGYRRNINGSYSEEYYNIGPFVRYTKELTPVFSLFGQLYGGFQKYSRLGPDYYGYSMGLFPAVEANIKNGFA